MIINVTQQDIDNGTPGDFCYCPVALALMRAICHHVSVVSDSWYVDGPINETPRYGLKSLPLPDSARAFIEAFDRKGEALPFSFEIEWAG